MRQRQCVVCKCETCEDERATLCQDCAGVTARLEKIHAASFPRQLHYEPAEYVAAHNARLAAHIDRV